MRKMCGGTALPAKARHSVVACTLIASTLVAVSLSDSRASEVEGPSAVATPDAAPASPPQTFDVFEYQVQGNTVLGVLDIEEAVMPYLGPGRTVEDVEAARAALETVYSQRGFATVSVEIPQQDVSGNVVTLQVVERKVGRLRVRGSRYFSLTALKDEVPSLAEGTVPNFDQVERDIVDANLLPDRRVTPVLKAGVAPGTVDVDLQVEDSFPLHGSLELNNRKSADTEPLRLAATARYDNLWQRGDSISFSYQVAPQARDDSEVFSGSYLARIPGSRASVLVYGLRSASDVATVGGTSVIGDGEIVGFRTLLPLTIEPGFVQSFSAGGDYKNFDEDVVLGADRTAAPITYYPVTLSYNADISDEGAETSLGANLVFTFGVIGSDRAEFDNKRANARPGFVIFQADASHLQPLPEGVQLFGRFTSQVTPSPLVSNEQFPLGGLDSVRGYLESEALGDYGAAIQAEVRSPSLGSLVADELTELRLLGFFDFGSTAIHKPLPEQDSTFTLASAGIGARVMILEHVGGAVDVAFALMDGPETDAGHVRTLFRAWGEF